MRRGPSRFVRSTTWGGLEAGDPCEVAGTTFAQKVRPRWTFHRHVLDTETGKEHIEVIGGKPGHLLNRAFSADRVTPVQVKKKRRVSA